MNKPHRASAGLGVVLGIIMATAVGRAAPGNAAAPVVEGGAKAGSFRVYVGTYTGSKTNSKGIYLFHLDAATGALTPGGLAGEVESPSFLAVHPSHKYLYAAGEVETFAGKDGKKGGAVSAFAVDPASGMLTLLNQQSSGGGGPCYVTVDAAGKNVLVANYGGGSVSVLPAGDDGRLKAPSAFVQHSGSGTDPKRQKGPHAHCIDLDPAGRFALACDLGLDEVLVYRFDAAAGTITPNDPPAGAVVPGAGPRHLAFHPSGKFAYVINEMASTVTAFRYDAAKGSLAEIETMPTVPKGVKVNNSTAEILVHPSGRFVYGSNRGHDSIAVFEVDEATGKLTPVGHTPTGGKTPRNFGIDPTGTFLLAANQGSNNIVVFRIDPATGSVAPTGVSVDVPSPVCVKFVPAGGVGAK